MSGGHFDYKQYQIHQCADEVEQLIRTNDSTEKDEWGYEGPKAAIKNFNQHKSKQ